MPGVYRSLGIENVTAATRSNTELWSRQTIEAVTGRRVPGVPRRPGPATPYGQSLAVLERDAHFRRCGVKIAVRWTGNFSEWLP
jgi:hypothetical protein